MLDLSRSIALDFWVGGKILFAKCAKKTKNRVLSKNKLESFHKLVPWWSLYSNCVGGNEFTPNQHCTEHNLVSRVFKIQI